MKINFKSKYVVTAVALFSSTSIFAASGEALRTFLKDPFAYGFTIAVVFILIALLALNKALNTLKYLTIKQTQGEEAAEKLKEKTVLSSMTEATSAEEEAELLLDHNYDGIHELDNDLPPWWKWGFYITIAWAVVYSALYFGTGDIPTTEQEYAAEMEEAQTAVDAYLTASGGAIDESNVVYLSDDADLMAGKEIYLANCAACHLADGGGIVGPNLTDEYWIHGGGIVEIFSTIKYGVPAKGMIPWEDQLGPVAMQQVASYVLSLKGTTPATPKAAEGEKWIDADAPASDEAPADAENATTEEPVTEETT